jgi:nucleoside-diphosphate-sugar epimerase
VRIFIAGASGVIGTRLVPLLIKEGHTVAGMTRSPDKASLLRTLGAEVVVCDVFDAAALTRAMVDFGSDLVFHQLTDLPERVEDILSFGERNNRIRGEGTRNLLAAAATAGADRVIAQSISWEQPIDRGRAATAEHERAILDAGGVVIRYGQFWGPGTYYQDRPPDPPRIHIDDAARQTLPSLAVPPGVTLVADDRATAAAGP